MADQTEALWLADAMDCVTDDACGYCMPCRIAAELRRLAAIEAERDALRADAERYRWLREWMVLHSILCLEYGYRWNLRKPHYISSSVGCGETEDAAIDAAMKGGGNG